MSTVVCRQSTLNDSLYSTHQHVGCGRYLAQLRGKPMSPERGQHRVATLPPPSAAPPPSLCRAANIASPSAQPEEPTSMMPAGLLSPTLAVWPSGRRPGAFLHVGRSGDGEVCAAGRWPDLAAVRGARRGADLVAGMCGPVARWRVEWSSCER
jgi:hypothetical protein